MTTYRRTNEDSIQKVGIVALLMWLHNIVRGECGDGTVRWVTKRFKLDYLLPIVQHTNDCIFADSKPWEIIVTEDKILWGENQEWIAITPYNEKENFHTDAKMHEAVLIY